MKQEITVKLRDKTIKSFICTDGIGDSGAADPVPIQIRQDFPGIILVNHDRGREMFPVDVVEQISLAEVAP